MSIKKIRLKNIRGFKELEFDLSRNDKDVYAGWTVFTGDNGSGKSSLLKAISIALIGKDASRALQTTFEGWIRFGEKESMIELEIIPHSSEDTFSPQGNSPKNHFTIGFNFNQNSGKEPVVKAISRMKARPSTVGVRGPWSLDAAGWFLLRVWSFPANFWGFRRSSTLNEFVHDNPFCKPVCF
jgi:predicted ATP-binding protein involved in virulence